MLRAGLESLGKPGLSVYICLKHLKSKYQKVDVNTYVDVHLIGGLNVLLCLTAKVEKGETVVGPEVDD